MKSKMPIEPLTLLIAAQLETAAAQITAGRIIHSVTISENEIQYAHFRSRNIVKEEFHELVKFIKNEFEIKSPN